jgi:hypothetical protein
MTIAYETDTLALKTLRYSCLNAKKVLPDLNQVIVTFKGLEDKYKTLLKDLDYVQIITLDSPHQGYPLAHWPLIYYGYKTINDDILYCGPLTYLVKDIRPIVNLSKINITYSKVEKIEPKVLQYIETINALLDIEYDLSEVIHSSFMFLPKEAIVTVEKINQLSNIHREKLRLYGREHDYNVNFTLCVLEKEFFLLKDVLTHLTSEKTTYNPGLLYNTKIDNPYLAYVYNEELMDVIDQIPT